MSTCQTICKQLLYILLIIDSCFGQTCYTIGPCENGYMDMTDGDYLNNECGSECEGGKYFTDSNCKCACIPAGPCPHIPIINGTNTSIPIFPPIIDPTAFYTTDASIHLTNEPTHTLNIRNPNTNNTDMSTIFLIIIGVMGCCIIGLILYIIISRAKRRYTEVIKGRGLTRTTMEMYGHGPGYSNGNDTNVLEEGRRLKDDIDSDMSIIHDRGKDGYRVTNRDENKEEELDENEAIESVDDIVHVVDTMKCGRNVK